MKKYILEIMAEIQVKDDSERFDKGWGNSCYVNATTIPKYLKLELGGNVYSPRDYEIHINGISVKEYHSSVTKVKS
jgi:hypothetical protein